MACYPSYSEQELLTKAKFWRLLHALWNLTKFSQLLIVLFHQIGNCLWLFISCLIRPGFLCHGCGWYTKGQIGCRKIQKMKREKNDGDGKSPASYLFFFAMAVSFSIKVVWVSAWRSKTRMHLGFIWWGRSCNPRFEYNISNIANL